MVACRQTWCWRRNWEFYILTHRQQKRLCIGCSLSRYEASKPTPTVTHFFQQGHIYSNKVTPPYNVTPFGGHLLSNHHSGQKQLGRERVISSYNSQVSLHHWGKSGQKFKAGIEAEAMEDHCLLACLIVAHLAAFLYNAGPPAQVWHSPLWADLPHIDH